MEVRKVYTGPCTGPFKRQASSYSRIGAETAVSERPSATVSHAFDLFNFHPHVSLPPFIDLRLSLIASSSTTGARYLRTNHTSSRLHSPPPFLFPFHLLTLSPYLGQRRLTLSRSRTALVRPQYIR